MKTTNSTAKKLSSLRISVMGLNELHAYAIAQLTAILPQITSYLGQKIVLSGGELAAKFKVAKPGQIKEKKTLYFLDNNGYFSPSGSSLWIRFRTCINGGSHDDRTAFCEYFDIEVYIGQIEDQELKSVYSLEQIIKGYKLRTDLTVGEMEVCITNFNKAKEQAQEALNLIPRHIQNNQYLKLY
jgi:hypothetical protein